MRHLDGGVARLCLRHDAELALPTATIAEIAFGISTIRPDRRADRLEQGLPIGDAGLRIESSA